jgi:hypothetical protein
VVRRGFTFPWLPFHLEGAPALPPGRGALVALVLFLEVALIAMQAARGVTSHFNVSTLFDMIVFNCHGERDRVPLGSAVLDGGAHLRQRFDDPVLASSLRLALVVTLPWPSGHALGTSATWSTASKRRHGVSKRKREPAPRRVHQAGLAPQLKDSVPALVPAQL